MNLPKALENIIKSENFTIYYHEDANCISFSTLCSTLKEFEFTIDNDGDVSHLRDNILAYYRDFDVSYETFIQLDNSGHGENGALYDMKELYEETEECQDFIMDLYKIVDNYIQIYECISICG